MKKWTKTILLLCIMIASAALFAIVFVSNTIGTDVILPDANLPVVSSADTTSEMPIHPEEWGTGQSEPPGETELAEGPIRIEIPSLNIDTSVVAVGKTPAGNMATPGSYKSVGWYKYGTLPGQQGSAVMAGHVDNGLALPGVFKHLEDMQQGDLITVTSREGIKHTFSVVSMHTYHYKNAPVEEIFNQNDAAYLKLITCTGTLIRSERTYDERLVVTAKLVE